MEIMVFEEGLTKSYTSLEEIDHAQLVMKIVDSPEDYVVLLTPEEWEEWFKLHIKLAAELLKTKTHNERMRLIDDFAERNASNLLALTCLVSAHPKFGNYKVGNLTPKALGDCYAIFYAKEEQVMQKSEEVTRKILRFREEQVNKPPLS